MSRPTAAPAHFPYAHRTLAEVRADELRAIQQDVELEAMDRASTRRSILAIHREEDLPYFSWGQAPQYVYREPCAMCGARADVGCKHRAWGQAA